MKVIGKGNVHVYSPEDEYPHVPGEEEFWQESWVVYFFDPEKNIYAFLRMSQEPNRDGGAHTHWVHVWTPQHMYRNVQAVPISAGDRTDDSLTANKGLCTYHYDGKFNWVISDPENDFEMKLVLEDFHPGIGPYAEEEVGSLVSQANKHHIEATGHATGTVRAPGEQHEISGMYWRDHSWGMRNWDNIRTHRAFYALFGKDFSFFPITFIGADNQKVKAGAVIRNDTVYMTTDFDLLSYMGSDGVTNAGGQVKLRLDGETLVMNFVPQTTCSISTHHNFVLADTMCTVTMGDRVGVGVTETSTNPQGGKLLAGVSAPSQFENGLFPRVRDPWSWGLDR